MYRTSLTPTNSEEHVKIAQQKRGRILQIILIGIFLPGMFSKKQATAQTAPSSPQTVDVGDAKTAPNEVVIFQHRKLLTVRKNEWERIDYRKTNRQSFPTGYMRKLYKNDGINLQELHIVNFSVMAKFARKKMFFLGLKDVNGNLITSKKIKLEFPCTMGKYKNYSIDINPILEKGVAGLGVLEFQNPDSKVAIHKITVSRKIPYGSEVMGRDENVYKATTYPDTIGVFVLNHPILTFIGVSPLIILVILSKFRHIQASWIGLWFNMFISFAERLRPKINNALQSLKELYGIETYNDEPAKHPLNQTDNVPTIRSLIIDLRNLDPVKRQNAAIALGPTGSKQAIRPLGRALKDRDQDVRAAVKESLTQILIKTLNDKNPRTRAIAARALGKIGGRRCVKSLTKIVNDKDLRVSEAAKEGLILNTIKAFSSKEPDVRANAAKALGKIESTRSVKSLCGILRDKDPRVRSNAAKSLGIIGSKRACKSLTRALKDKDPAVRSAAKEALELIKTKTAPAG